MFTFLQTKRSRAIDACLQGIIQDPPPAWLIIRPSIGHAATVLQKRLRQEGIDISFEKACKRVENYKRGKK